METAQHEKKRPAGLVLAERIRELFEKEAASQADQVAALNIVEALIVASVGTSP